LANEKEDKDDVEVGIVVKLVTFRCKKIIQKSNKGYGNAKVGLWAHSEFLNPTRVVLFDLHQKMYHPAPKTESAYFRPKSSEEKVHEQASQQREK
jgi:hypothetical protein